MLLVDGHVVVYLARYEYTADPSDATAGFALVRLDPTNTILVPIEAISAFCCLHHHCQDTCTLTVDTVSVGRAKCARGIEHDTTVVTEYLVNSYL